MTHHIRRWLTSISALLALCASSGIAGAGEATWQKDFDLSKCNMVATGRNDYFILEPGFQLVLEGGGTRVQITVLDETRPVGGVLTRVVEEREWKKGQLYEVARNYFAICEQTKDVYYFGEDVDFYKSKTPAGTFSKCMKVKEGSELEPSVVEYKYHAPGIGLVRDEDLRLVKYGSINGK
jgi:hypothetical protein